MRRLVGRVKIETSVILELMLKILAFIYWRFFSFRERFFRFRLYWLGSSFSDFSEFQVDTPVLTDRRIVFYPLLIKRNCVSNTRQDISAKLSNYTSETFKRFERLNSEAVVNYPFENGYFGRITLPRALAKLWLSSKALARYSITGGDPFFIDTTDMC